MTKAELRRRFLAERKALSSDEVERRSRLIASHFFAWLTGSGRADTPSIIHTFLPIRHQNEVNTWLIIKHLWEHLPNIRVAIPITNPSDNSLSHSLLFPETPLELNRWGIPEPSANDRQLIHPIDISIVIVPLLAFDLHGQRVGYGGGFYDRFLAECRPDCQKVGLSLAEPFAQIEGVESTDIRLNSCITPDRAYCFD